MKAASVSSADVDNNKLVTATEAFAYARNKVLGEWDAHNTSSTFIPHISGGSGDIVLYDKR